MKSPAIPNQFLIDARNDRGLSQANVASVLATTTQVVNRWERGKEFPNPYYRQKLCEFYGKSARELGLIPSGRASRPEEIPLSLPEPEEVPPQTNAPLGDAGTVSESQSWSQQQEGHEVLSTINVFSAQESLSRESNVSINQAEPVSSSETLHAENAPSALFQPPYASSPFFMGRERSLEEIHTLLSTPRIGDIPWPVAIVGLGGVGKTQLALHYAILHRHEYQAMVWAKADSCEVLTTAFVALSHQLHLPASNEQDQQACVIAVKRWLQEQTDWLLIFDNVTDFQMLEEFIPATGQGHILVTTRFQVGGGKVRSFELREFCPEEGALLLLRRSGSIAHDGVPTDTAPSDRETALEVAELLGGLPLALDQAGAYIEETQCGIAGYQERYQAQRKHLLQWRSAVQTDYPASVATTWLLSFQRVRQLNRAAGELLTLCAFLDADSIPVEMITKGASHLGFFLRRAAADPLKLDAAIGVLLRFSLLRRTSTNNALSLHRLVQAVLVDQISERAQRRWAKRAIHVVDSAFSSEPLHANASQERYIPHARLCLTYIQRWRFTFYTGAHLLLQASWLLHERGFADQAEQFCLQALHLYERGAGLYSPAMATALTNAAIMYERQGKYEAAELHARFALAIEEKEDNLDDPSVGNSLCNLARICRRLGKYDEARALGWRALGILEASLGPNDLLVATTLDTLAMIAAEQGDHFQAESLYQRSLHIREQARGTEDREVATSLQNLGTYYASRRNYQQAEEYCRRALQIFERLLGSDHPTTAKVLSAVAEILAAQGQEAEAEALNHRAIGLLEQRLGSDHPDLAPTLFNLAALYQGQQKYAEAESLIQRVLSIVETHLGADHPKAAYVLYQRAILFQEMGRIEEAVEARQRAQAIEEQCGIHVLPH